MRALRLHGAGRPLIGEDVPRPSPEPGQVVVAVRTCGVCRTDLHIADGELTNPKLPLTLGHQIVGEVKSLGSSVNELRVGERVGIPWLGWTCGKCERCRVGEENLCEKARFTGYDLDGGFAELTVADAPYCFPLPDTLDDAHAAPLLCAGLIGYRAMRMAGDAERLGFYGFGSSAHLMCQLAVQQGRQVYAFVRPGDGAGQTFARSMGCRWAGASTEPAPEPLDAAIIFASDGELVPAALRSVRPGGTVVCAGIHMSDIPSFPYELLWGERTVRSVANLTRRDGAELFATIAQHPIRPEVTMFDLAQANEALAAVRSGSARGSVVLRVPR